MDELLTIEKQTIEYRRGAQKLRREAGKLSASARTEIQDLNSQARFFDLKRKELKNGKWLLRYVGDGIAWHAYRHSRNHIRALSDKEPVNTIGKPENFIPYRRLFRGFRHRGKNFLPLMHDITNCLRVGDLTVFNRGKLFKIYEWKIFGPDSKYSSEQASREKRQALRLGRLRAYFETNQINCLSAQYPRNSRFIKIDVQEKYHFELISRILAQARKKPCRLRIPKKVFTIFLLTRMLFLKQMHQ